MVQTKFQRQNSLRNRRIYDDYQAEINANPKKPKGIIHEELRKRYKINAPSTIYTILNRVKLEIESQQL